MHLSLLMQKGILILQSDTELLWQSTATFGRTNIWVMHCRQQWKEELKEKLNLVVLKLKLIGMFLIYAIIIPVLSYSKSYFSTNLGKDLDWRLFPSLPGIMCDSGLYIVHLTNLNLKVSVGDWSLHSCYFMSVLFTHGTGWMVFISAFVFSLPSPLFSPYVVLYCF